MGRFDGHIKDKKVLPKVEPVVTRSVNVETLMETTGMRFIVSFSFKLPEGTNNFSQLSEMVDNEINEGRNAILKKVAQKLGAKVNFEN